LSATVDTADPAKRVRGAAVERPHADLSSAEGRRPCELLQSYDYPGAEPFAANA
jgi:hypothetical protein